MGLADLARAVGQTLRDNGCPAETYYGEQHIADHVGGYTVVWVPTADSFGERLPSGSESRTTMGLVNPRSLKTRFAGAMVTLKSRPPELAQAGEQWAQYYAAMETFIDAFIAALHKETAGNYVLTGGSYMTDQARHVAAGLNYELSITVGVPVLDIPWPLAATTTACAQTYQEAPAVADVTVQEQISPPDYETALTYSAP